jgi:flagellar hook-basal body complex protein FliE
MALPIAPINVTAPASIATPKPLAEPGAGRAFGSVLQDAISKVEHFRLDANASVDRFLSGEGEELHTMALKTQQAELAFDLFLQVRNKIVSAYQEVMRMQV